jgi:hypothetical protein
MLSVRVLFAEAAVGLRVRLLHTEISAKTKTVVCFLQNAQVEICLWQDQRLCKQHCWLVCLNTRIRWPTIYLISNENLPLRKHGHETTKTWRFGGRYHLLAFVDVEVRKTVLNLEDVATAILWEGYGLKVRLRWRRAVCLPTDSKWLGTVRHMITATNPPAGFINPL